MDEIMNFINNNLIYIIIGAAILLLIIILIVVKKTKKKIEKKQVEKITKAEHTEDGRFSLAEDVVSFSPDGEANASFTKQDVIVGKGQTVVAGKNNDIAVGKWVVLTTIDGVDAFNVRINGFVREITHNSTIVLGEGDSICPVSHSIILR